jgi:hypothetical protein
MSDYYHRHDDVIDSPIWRAFVFAFYVILLVSVCAVWYKGL